VKRLGLPTEFLGMQIRYDIATGSMRLYQEDYIRKIATNLPLSQEEVLLLPLQLSVRIVSRSFHHPPEYIPV
jgi:hypothetical protein